MRQPGWRQTSRRLCCSCPTGKGPGSSGLRGTAAMRALHCRCQGRQDLQARLTGSPYTVQQRKGIFGPGWAHGREGWEAPAVLATNERWLWMAGMPDAGLMAHITSPFSTHLGSTFCRGGFGLLELSFQALCSFRQHSGTSDIQITFLRFSWKQQGQKHNFMYRIQGSTWDFTGLCSLWRVAKHWSSCPARLCSLPP